MTFPSLLSQSTSTIALSWRQGDIEIDGKAYRILAVKVKCGSNTVYSAGDPPQGVPPDHTQSYMDSPVVIELWLEEIPQEELQNCEGYSQGTA